MGLSSFLKLVEIQTKVASVIPFILGTVFAIYKFENFHIAEALVFFTGMILFDMATTAINNYIDYKKAIKKDGFGYEEHNAIVRDGLKPTTVKLTILSLLVIASLLGIVLFLQTDWIVLIVGVICFSIGILYSFGPIPISRTPFGEIFSGTIMGGMITFLAIYIHIYDQGIIALNFRSGLFELSANIRVLIEIVLVSIPAIIGIANIMLANNLCDIEDDIVNRRYTLPIYIGKEKGLQLFKWSYDGAILIIVLSVILRILPVFSLLTILVMKKVHGNVERFTQLQSKEKTFVLAVKNFIIINVVYIATIILGCLL